MSTSQILIILEKYQGSDPLPLLLGLIQIINPNGNNVLNDEIINDYVLIEKSSYIIDRLADCINADNIYRYITDCNNIARNKLWHGIFMAFITRNVEYSCHYIDSIDFSYNAESLGEYSYQVIKYFCKDDNSFNAFSLSIYNKYLSALENINSRYYIHFTSYYQYIFNSIRILSNNSFSTFLVLLEERSLNLLRAIHSWNHNQLTRYFTNWFYWIISAKSFSNINAIEKGRMPMTYGLLNDKRIFQILNCDINGQHITFDGLIDFLDNPESIKSILLPDNNDIVEIKWLKM
jgi:hypothetical protein